MQLVKVSVLAILVAACGAVQKPPEPSRRLDVHLAGGVFEIDAGYRFATLPDPGSNVVRLDVRYPIGSADDPAGKEGLAHLVEHLLFEVELDRDGRKTSIGAELGRIALWSNAVTYPDYTTYQVMAEPRALRDLLELEVDRMAVGCAGLTPAIVAREREVVINELREHRGASGDDVQRQIRAAVFPVGHPYRHVDSIESVRKLELADVCAFLATSYRRGKAFVVASGAITQASFQAAASSTFGRVPARDLALRPTPAVVQPGPGVVHLKVDVDEPTFIITLPLPPMASREYRLLELGWNAIGPHLARRAFEFGWGHSPDTWIMGGVYAPVLAISIVLEDAKHLDEAIGAADQAMQYAARALSRPGDDRDTPNWREHWQAGAESVLARWESLDGRNAMFADFMQFDPSDQFLIGRIGELVNSEPKVAHDAAEKWLSANHARYLLLEPTGTVATHGRKTYLGGGSPAHGPVVDAATADRPLPIPDTSLAIATERYTLGNGLQVVLWPHGTSPLVHGRLVVDSGSAHDPGNAEGVAWLVGESVYLDSMVETDRSLSTRVDDLVVELSEHLRKPSFTYSDEVQKFLRGRLALTRARERATYDLALRTALYGKGHPYARPSMSEASLGHISTDLVTGWARDHVVPKNATLILAGAFDPAIVKRHVAYDLDQVSSGRDSPDRDDVEITTPGYIAGVTEKPTPTVELSLNFVAGRGLDADYARRLVLETVLDAQLATLRTKDAVTYGFSASYAPRRGGGQWSIGGDADATRASEAAVGLATIVDAMRRDPESYRASFVLGRQKALEALLVGTTSSAAIADRLALLARFDLPDRFFDTVARDIARLTLADFHRFVVRELAIDGQVVGAFGNDDAVAAALAAAKRAHAP